MWQWKCVEPRLSPQGGAPIRKFNVIWKNCLSDNFQSVNRVACNCQCVSANCSNPPSLLASSADFVCLKISYLLFLLICLHLITLLTLMCLTLWLRINGRISLLDTFHVVVNGSCWCVVYNVCVCVCASLVRSRPNKLRLLTAAVMVMVLIYAKQLCSSLLQLLVSSYLVVFAPSRIAYFQSPICMLQVEHGCDCWETLKKIVICLCVWLREWARFVHIAVSSFSLGACV